MVVPVPPCPHSERAYGNLYRCIRQAGHQGGSWPGSGGHTLVRDDRWRELFARERGLPAPAAADR